jgi:hypothetical protein
MGLAPLQHPIDDLDAIFGESQALNLDPQTLYGRLLSTTWTQSLVSPKA